MSGSHVEQAGWRAARLVVVDIETTGLDPARDEIIAFAAIPIVEGRIRPGELVSTLVRPQRNPGPETIRIHGLRERDLSGEPPLAERLHVIRSALAGSVLVAHCAWIETGFLTAALAGVGAGVEGPVIDTMALGPVVLRARGIACADGPSLGGLARLLGLPVHRPHHADGDALTTAQVFLALASQFGGGREATVGELARAGRQRGLRDRLLGR